MSKAYTSINAYIHRAAQSLSKRQSNYLWLKSISTIQANMHMYTIASQSHTNDRNWMVTTHE